MPERPVSDADINKLRASIATSAEIIKTGLLSPLDPELETSRRLGLRLLIEDSLESNRLNVELLDNERYQQLLSDLAKFFLTYEREEPIYWARDMRNVAWRPTIVRPLDAHLACLAYSLYNGIRLTTKNIRHVSTNYSDSMDRVWDRLKAFEETTGTLSRNFVDLPIPNLQTAQNQPPRIYRDKSRLGTISQQNWRNAFITERRPVF